MLEDIVREIKVDKNIEYYFPHFDRIYNDIYKHDISAYKLGIPVALSNEEEYNLAWSYAKSIERQEAVDKLLKECYALMGA